METFGHGSAIDAWERLLHVVSDSDIFFRFFVVMVEVVVEDHCRLIFYLLDHEGDEVRFNQF